jgi:soluble lytic murein transglycosylase-like protein
MWSGGLFACWDGAAQRYQINARLLYAIAKCESDMRPGVVNRSHRARTGTYDIGLMQINSSNLQRLGAYGIDEQQLYDACTNIHVGAWILADKIQRYGLSWEAVGAYNAACSELKGKDCAAARSRYAWCVYRNLSPVAHMPSAAMHPSARESVPVIATRVAP